MKRREFIGLVGGAAALPIAAAAQQDSGLRRLAMLSNVSENSKEGQQFLSAFRRGMRELGWTKGRNVELMVRWARAE
jgi:putative ABC transport system substrate-binding protein